MRQLWVGTAVGHGQDFEVGQRVHTDYTGQLTRHKITEISPSITSPTRIQVRVAPAPKGSVYVNDKDKPVGNPWFDSAWFRRESVTQGE